MSTKDSIYSAFLAALPKHYKVIKAWDSFDSVDPSGSFAVNVTDIEDLHHSECTDCRFAVTVSGFTTADEDRYRETINRMVDLAGGIDIDAVRDAVTGCVGVVRNEISIQSDGDSNQFTQTFDVFVCDVQFV